MNTNVMSDLLFYLLIKMASQPTQPISQWKFIGACHVLVAFLSHYLTFITTWYDHYASSTNLGPEPAPSFVVSFSFTVRFDGCRA